MDEVFSVELPAPPSWKKLVFLSLSSHLLKIMQISSLNKGVKIFVLSLNHKVSFFNVLDINPVFGRVILVMGFSVLACVFAIAN